MQNNLLFIIWRFPFNQNVWFKFSGNFQKRKEQHFPKFPKRRTTSRVILNFLKNFSRKFSFHFILLPEFLEFSVKWFVFRKLNSFWNFWKLLREIFEPFAAACPASKFSKVLVECKSPSNIRQLLRPNIIC